MAFKKPTDSTRERGRRERGRQVGREREAEAEKVRVRGFRSTWFLCPT